MDEDFSRQTKARISKLQNWLKEESEKTEPPPPFPTTFKAYCHARHRRKKQKERLQYLAAGTAGTRAPQGTGYGTITDRAAVQSMPVHIIFSKYQLIYLKNFYITAFLRIS